MPQTIKRFGVVLSTIGVVGSISIPAHWQEVALRVADKYTPPAHPPDPEVVILAIATDPQPGDLAGVEIVRNFVLIHDGDELPQNFVKYIGTVPFGTEKQVVDIIEVSD
jgi:hypothetical protein